ncbi:unnamed protein product, partial [Didymodactylos carnosus]
FQVELRGQRIATAEVENCILNSYPSEIKDCIVIKTVDDRTQEECLVAYLHQLKQQTACAPSNQLKIKDYCRRYLPEYMIPSVFIILDKLPLTETGKTNRRPLPKVDFSSVRTLTVDNHNYVQTETKLEIEVYNLWCKVLNQTRIPMNENFFNVGGSSLLLMRLHGYYQRNYFTEGSQLLTVVQLFEHPTISGHVQLLQSISDERRQQKEGQSTPCIPLNLTHAYLNQKLDDLSLQYLDYSIYEVSVVSSEEIEFWKRQLNGYEQHYLPLPYDRADQLYEIRSGRGSSISFTLTQDLFENIMKHIESTKTTLFHLFLTVYYIYLFKMTQEKVFCVAKNTGVYLQEVALNQIGEFYIGGCCVFCGYPNQPELTAEVLAELSPHRSLG